MTLAIRHKPRTLLIIGTSLYECAFAAKEFGLQPGQIENFRNVTKAIELRGVTAGTPYICINRQNWQATPHGFDLDRALWALERTGRVRLMRDDDLPNYRAFDGLPAREARI